MFRRVATSERRTDVVGFPFTRRNYHRMLHALLVRSFPPHVLHAHHYDESLGGSIVRRLGVVPYRRRSADTGFRPREIPVLTG